MKFIDEANIVVTSGHGGPGCVSFRREKYVAHGGPDGGDGGRGGDVVFVTDPQLWTLVDQTYARLISAENGRPGEGKRRSGAQGADRIVRLPVGTVVSDRGTGAVLADLSDPDMRVVIARGGRGGKGNTFFASPTNQAPRISQPGQGGVEVQIRLELKLLADAAIIGLPNAGKSTLISRISAARPKVAGYPFTTLVPNLGVVRVDEEVSFVVADVPGLIAGAHEGAGLGHRFLRHVERAPLFVHMVDVASQAPREALAAWKTVRREIGLYNKALLAYPEIVVLSKIDALNSEEVRLAEIRSLFEGEGLKPLEISAVTGEGLDALVAEMWRRVSRERGARARVQQSLEDAWQ